jgi:hypothetical protein
MAGPLCKTHLVSYATNEPLCHCSGDILFKAQRGTTFQKTLLTFFKNSIVTIFLAQLSTPMSSISSVEA